MSWMMEAGRGNPGATKDYLGFMKTGSQADLCSSLPNTWCICSFFPVLESSRYVLSDIARCPLLVLFHIFLPTWKTNFLEGDSFFAVMEFNGVQVFLSTYITFLLDAGARIHSHTGQQRKIQCSVGLFEKAPFKEKFCHRCAPSDLPC